MSLAAILAFLKLAWGNRKLVAIGLACAAVLGGILYVKHLQAASATAIAQRDQATAIAMANVEAVKELQLHQARMAGVRQTVTAAETKRTTAAAVVIQEILHAPEDNTPAGPGFDALGDRLRALESSARN